MQRAEPLEQLARGGRDAVDVLARLLAGLGAQLVARVVSAASMIRWTCDDAAAATGWAPRRRMPSTSSASSRRCASTASGS